LFFPGVAPLAAGARLVRSAHDARRDGPPLRAPRGDEELDQLRSEPDSAERGGRGAGGRGVPGTSPRKPFHWAADATQSSPISAPTRRSGGDEKPSREAAEKLASSLGHDEGLGHHKTKCQIPGMKCMATRGSRTVSSPGRRLPSAPERGGYAMPME